ncbi:bifunctional aminoglycoside phosphotransferase/ATP-binding protein [Chelatococcus asaccharovorans]|uniref:bifunctional aminoglycoside phosphotransferase/ATP-binding protein n=1 Tax=Chelatococcus asaccharovorans TaxID=28210 RepID=UPI00224C6762|nr:bifunctional aminoglycoside phosphotransferase/ATP-binding protein [Chelatococcus asaccharovorans]CAH1659774.1 APH domain-containing protein [Chelatococcus asaccharovorans]CAH1684067.1 APH domain-containing protein [Chelatococcus asaccharovorans]
MRVEDQTATLAFLTDPATHGGREVTTIETHISVVVLVGDEAFKLKRAVRLPYVDFSTVERRLAACRDELALNRRTAPTLYRAVRRVTREADGRLAFDGSGALVDAVVVMGRFDANGLFDRMAVEGRLTPALMTGLANTIARFHAEAAVSRERTGAAVMAGVLAMNERAFAATRIFTPEEVASLYDDLQRAFAGHTALLDARGRAGRIRHCHGDLHLRNICLVDGTPTLFDCLEFDANLATIDVLYDLAFLLMDLWHRGLAPYANLVANRYLDACDEADGLPLVPFFMAVRAAVRAHVTATQAEEARGDRQAELTREAKCYFDLTRRLLRPVPARLVAIGGLSGTGKSTLAAAIADRIGPPPGARILASDRVRKRLHGVSPETRLPAEAYRPEISREVYARLFTEAQATLQRGHAAIADAVFDRADTRAAIAACAAAAGVAFSGLWLDAPAATLVDRVAARRGDPSDATTDVVQAQLARGPGAVDWTRIEAGQDRAATVQAALDRLLPTDQGAR